MKTKTIFIILQVIGAAMILNVFREGNTYEKQVIGSVAGVLLILIPTIINYYVGKKAKTKEKTD